ncbi:MAG: carbohydrate-binding protein [Cellulosilyticaceae bacterium]
MFKKKQYVAWLLSLMMLVLGVAPMTFAQIIDTEVTMQAVQSTEWQAYTNYKVGDSVTYQGVNYACRQPHQSLPGWEPTNVPALWLVTEGGGGPIDPPKPPDKEDVTAPTGLQAVAKSTTTITVSWNAVTGAKGYELEMDGQVVQVSSNSYEHTGLAPNSSHRYKVRVLPSEQNMNYLWSSTVSAKTLEEQGPIDPNTPAAWEAGKVYHGGTRVSYEGAIYEAKWWTQGEKPDPNNQWGVWKYISGSVQPPKETVAAPTGVAAVAKGQNVIEVSWNSVSGVSSYELTVDGKTMTVPSNTYTHDNLKADTSHTYKVRVAPVDTAKDYLWSSTVSAKTDAIPPKETVPAPTGLKAVANGKNEIIVSWDGAATTGSYELMVDGKVMNVSGNTYTHTGLAVGSSHKYQVRVAPVTDALEYLWSVAILAKTESEPVVPGEIGEKLLIGYWHNFDNGSTNIRLRDIPAEWDVVQVAFGETTTDRAVVEFAPYNCTEEEFRQDIDYLNSRGVRVILSLGGQNGVIHIDSPQDVDKFVTSVCGLIDKYGFNGLDVDVENGITVAAGDKNLKNPATPRLKYMVEAINKVCDTYGDDFWLTMAPEIAYVQGGIVAFGGPWGGYLPIIEGVRHNLTMIHVQHYNCGGNAGLDGVTYTAGTADFQVAMAEMLMQGFYIANDPNAFFEPLRPDQVAIGIPAKPSAAPSGGYIAPTEMKKALDYLIHGKSYGGQYKLKNPEGYKGFRGVMTWSINWDGTQNNSFAKAYREYFDAMGGERLKPIQ